MSQNLGYRYFVDNYDNVETCRWDITQQGPVVGYSWAFCPSSKVALGDQTTDTRQFFRGDAI